MEPTDPTLENPSAARPSSAAGSRGLALFGVLILVVIFTLLGVGAISLSQRESRNSGSMIDIKSRQSAAYAGLQFALGEFQRDPDNFVALLEKWRTKSTALYGTVTNPLPPLYLSFSTAGAAVTLTKTKPAAFAIPGSSYKTVVELAGIQPPAVNSPTGPVIVLRATGTGRSGDEQTVLGAYAVRNIRLGGGGGGANLPITHPFFIQGTGNSTWNNRIETDGGDVFIGGGMYFNAATQTIRIRNGGLKIKGDMGWSANVTISVDSSSWVAGDLSVEDATVTFRKHLVVDGKVWWPGGPGNFKVLGTMRIDGSQGIEDMRAGQMTVGSAGVAPSQLAVMKGPVITSVGGASLTVNGDAYLHQLTSPNTKAMTLNVTRKLELSRNAALDQDFYGNGTWGQFIARDLKSGSSVIPSGGPITIGAVGTSWSETPSNLTMGTGGWPGPGNPINFSGSAKINRPNPPPCPPFTFPCPSWSWYLNPSSAAQNGGAPAGVSATANTDGFDDANPPKTPAQLGLDVKPQDVHEVGFNLDASVAAKALTLGKGGALCQDFNAMCGASLNKARTDDIAAGSSHFHNGYFVVKITSGNFGWDNIPGKPRTSPLVGKWLIIVDFPMASGASKWPTTATNPDPTNPANIQFVYVRTGANITGFQPRLEDPELGPVPFFGYVRIDGAQGTWDPQTSVDFQGAVHFMNPGQALTANSGGALPVMTLNQAVLNNIGQAFGSSFTDPTTGDPLAAAGPTGFVATENWIQFQPIAELR